MLVGLGSILHLSGGNTILQTIVEDDKRGRIMSLFTMSFLGVSPFGSLLAGSLANALGAPVTLIISGLVCVISGFLFVKQLPKLRLIVRPIYLAKKILPAVPL
jgi:MFS family permease